jgi:AraC family transcriptional regulator
LSIATIQPEASAAEREIAVQAEWRLTDYCCSAGPDDAAFEEAHDGVTIAAVISGRFRYRSDAGTVNFYPGATLLGNAGACYRCDHVHGVGDRCVVLSMRPDFFDEIAHGAARNSRFRFGSALLPPHGAVLRWSVLAELAAQRDAPAVDEAALAEAAAAIAAHVAGTVPARASGSRHERGRIRAICDLLVQGGGDASDLDGLARMAGVSKFHFVRLFRRETGVTPHQFRLAAQMRRAALRLARSRDPVAYIAYDSGFGDLSTFNARFRHSFGMTPTAFRNRH